MENRRYIQVDINPIFTRYLYVKNDVVMSLLLSILKKDVEKSLFWGFELYYSGFKQDLIDLLLFIYVEFHKKLNSIKVKHFIYKKILEWKSDYNNDSLIATIIANIACRDSDPIDFLKKYGNRLIDRITIELYDVYRKSKNNKKIIYIIYNESDIKKYQTISVDKETKAYRILRKACKYYSVKNAYSLFNYIDCPFLKKYKPYLTRKQLTEYYRYNWEYHAYLTPVWKYRFKNFRCLINYGDSSVIFYEEEAEEMFYEEYGYEPDEQSAEVFDNCIGYENDEIIAEMSLENFVTYNFDV